MSKQPKPPIGEDLALPFQVIERRIYLVRGHKVMLDADLAELYQVPTKVLKQSVRRHQQRFPDDCIFQLTEGKRKT